MGIVFNIQRYSIQDGPGVRTVVFLKGCSLHCWWCSNPESQQFQPQVGHSDSLCNQCGLCVEACPTGAISLDGENNVHIDRKLCKNCGSCADACAVQAIKVYGREMSVDEVLEVVLKDRGYYTNSGGGVTASGGEPLCQVDFVTDLFKRSQENGIHTALETCGAVGSDAFEQVIPYTRLFLFDIKHMDPEVHKKYTGSTNEQILKNFKLVAASGIPVIARVPLIPGVNDTDEALRAIGKFVVEHVSEPRIELMPYHRYGVGKYHMLDREYKLDNVTTQSEDELERIRKAVASAGVEPLIVG